MKTARPGGNLPAGRNGHTATLVGTLYFHLSHIYISIDHKLYIIGGWLGQGPLAADDMHILDLKNFKWLDLRITGVPPGPCNMHTADSYDGKIYVFRGGDGRDYLNDLHCLDTDACHWTKVSALGTYPPP